MRNTSILVTSLIIGLLTVACTTPYTNSTAQQKQLAPTEAQILASYTGVNPTPDAVQTLLIDNGVRTPQDYDKALIEANLYKDYKTTPNSTPYQKWRAVTEYLTVKKSANGDGVSIDKWKERAIANGKKAQEKMDAEYPFVARITCTMNGGVVQTLMCFTPSYMGAGGTELELQNGDSYKMYQFLQIPSVGPNINGVLLISLRNKFTLTMQNASPNALLNLEIRESATKKVIFQKSTGQWGVISVKN